MTKHPYKAIMFLLGILGYTNAPGQMCDTALQREKVTPTINFYDFNGTTGDGNVSTLIIFPQTQGLGWTSSGAGTVFAMSNATVFNNEDAISTVTQSFTRPVTNANLAGTGAVVTVVLSPKNTSGGSTPVSTSFNPSIKATYEVLYGNTVYLRIVTTDDSSTTATVTPLNNASVTVNGNTTSTGSATTIPMTANGAWPASPTWSTLAITLPATIANNANLATRFSIGAVSYYPGGITRAGDDYVVRSISFKSCPANIAGRIFQDTDGPSGAAAGTGIGAPGGMQLYASLINASGNVVASVPADTSGAYTLPGYASGNFTVRVSTTQGTPGQPAPAAGLPPGWAAVSETDGTANLSQPVTVANANTNTALTGNNFGINQIPVAVNDTLAGQALGAPATIPDILANDTDPGNGILSPDSISLIAPADATGIAADAQGDTTGFAVPGEGTWSLNSSTGAVTFTPETAFTGNPASVGYTVTDTAGLKSNTATIFMEYNQFPAALNDTATTPVNTSLNGSVYANDTCRIEPCNYTALPSGLPANGAVTMSSDGSYTYTPNTGFTGTDTFSYVLCNGATPSALCDTAQVALKIGNVLPVNLVYFAADIETGCDVLLRWMTGVELSFDRFDIEWGTDGVKFVPVSSVPAKGSGSSYSYLYRHGVKGINYFRLKETDRDGSYRYSRIATANLGCAPERKIMVYPTVHNGYVTIEGLQTGESVLVYDMKGISVLQAKATGPVVKLNLSHTASGSYTIVILTLTGERMHYKIVKQQ